MYQWLGMLHTHAEDVDASPAVESDVCSQTYFSLC